MILLGKYCILFKTLEVVTLLLFWEIYFFFFWSSLISEQLFLIALYVILVDKLLSFKTEHPTKDRGGCMAPPLFWKYTFATEAFMEICFCMSLSITSEIASYCLPFHFLNLVGGPAKTKLARSHHSYICACRENRSSRTRTFYGIGFSQNLAKFPGKHVRWSVLLVKVTGFKPLTLLIKDSITDCFPDIFAKILQNSFFTKHIWATSWTFLQHRNSEKEINFGTTSPDSLEARPS